MNEVPLFDHEQKVLGTFRHRTKAMRKVLEEIGVKKDFMLANNEFGMNWHVKSYPGFNRYSLSLVNLELGLEMFKSGLDQMALWNGVGFGFMGKTMLRDNQYGNRMNPVHFGLEMLWKSVGLQMLEVETSAERLHGFCATDGYDKVICYLLNKYPTEKTVDFTGPGFDWMKLIGLLHPTAKISIETLMDPEGPLNSEEEKSWYEQWEGHWGKVEQEENTFNLKEDQKLLHTVPALSFVTLTFSRPCSEMCQRCCQK